MITVALFVFPMRCSCFERCRSRLFHRTEREVVMSSPPDAEAVFATAINEHLNVVSQVREPQPVLQAIARAMSATVSCGGKVLRCGNGGSAADPQHLATELVGRFRRERRGLASIALTTDTSILTAIGNDYGYNPVFCRQVEALGTVGDVLAGISTSGNSRNVVAALDLAHAQGMITVAFTDAGGGEMGGIVDHLFAVSSHDTARIQEAHILAGHMLCDWIELDAMAAQPALTKKVEQIDRTTP